VGRSGDKGDDVLRQIVALWAASRDNHKVSRERCRPKVSAAATEIGHKHVAEVELGAAGKQSSGVQLSFRSLRCICIRVQTTHWYQRSQCRPAQYGISVVTTVDEEVVLPDSSYRTHG
jgi:hypothetical protein